MIPIKAIVFIGTLKSGSSREAIKAAEKLGYYTILFTERDSQIKQRKEYTDVHQMIYCDLFDLEALRKKIRQIALRAIEIVAIVSFTEPYCYTATKLAHEFGVGHFSEDAIYKMQNKVLSRETIKDTSYVPWFKLLKGDEYKHLDTKKLLPFIMKNPTSTGSKEVHLIQTVDEFIEKYEIIRKKYTDQPILIEEYLDGQQYLVEVLVEHKKIHIIAVIEQEINLHNGHFIVTGYHLITNRKTQFYEKLKVAVRDIVRLHGMEHGACHLELRLVKDNWKLIEINPRISGSAMNEIIEIGLGINLVKETLKLNLGDDIHIKPKYKRHTFAQFIILNKNGRLIKVTGRNLAKKMIGVKKVFIKPRRGTLLTKPVSMGSRYAYVIATGRSGKEAKERAKKAASKIVFHLQEE